MFAHHLLASGRRSNKAIMQSLANRGNETKAPIWYSPNGSGKKSDLLDQSSSTMSASVDISVCGYASESFPLAANMGERRLCKLLNVSILLMD